MLTSAGNAELCLCLTADDDEEDEMQRQDDSQIWSDYWAAGAPWHSFARHFDPIGTSSLIPLPHKRLACSFLYHTQKADASTTCGARQNVSVLHMQA